MRHCFLHRDRRAKIGWMENQVPKEVFGGIGPHHVLRIRSFITEVEFWVVSTRSWLGRLGEQRAARGAAARSRSAMSCKIGL